MAAPRDQEDDFSCVIKSVSFRFLCMKSVHEAISSYDLENFDEKLQQKLLQETIFHPLCLKYPPSIKYRKKAMKHLITQLEESGVDIVDEFYDAYTTLMSDDTRMTGEEEGFCYKTYSIPNGKFVTMGESVSLISQGTTGLQTWQAAQHLAEFLIENGKVINERSVIELGCGLGFTGIVGCLALEPKRYTFSDYHPEVLNRLKRNLEINGLLKENVYTSGKDRALEKVFRLRGEGAELNCHEDSSLLTLEQSPGRVNVMPLDWEEVTECLVKELDIDVVLAADVVYDLRIIPSLVKVLKLFIENGAVGYIASTIRNQETFDAFLGAVDASQITSEVLEGPMEELFLYDRDVPIKILKLSAVK